jgi:hypothetical protein
LFSPRDISYRSKRVDGYFLRVGPKGVQWKRCRVPYPDVVYNRVFRFGETTSSFKKAKQTLQQNGTKIFNPHTFNKWSIYEKIKHVEEIKPFIPETIKSPGKKQLEQLLRTHGMIYLKPVEGFMGFGIVKIQHQGNAIFCQYNLKGNNVMKRFSNLPAAIHHIFGQRSLKKYIAQQGIQLLKKNGRHIDFRIHTNRDRYGKWQMTAAAAKMAGRGSVTTHVRTGGKLYRFEDVLKKYFPHGTHQQVINAVDYAVIALSKAIEDHLPNYVGDIGFDIGIDQQGQPWMFEANAQPGRHIFALPGLKESEVKTRNMILEYALHLAQFSEKDDVYA